MIHTDTETAAPSGDTSARFVNNSGALDPAASQQGQGVEGICELGGGGGYTARGMEVGEEGIMQPGGFRQPRGMEGDEEGIYTGRGGMEGGRGGRGGDSYRQRGDGGGADEEGIYTGRGGMEGGGRGWDLYRERGADEEGIYTGRGGGGGGRGGDLYSLYYRERGGWRGTGCIIILGTGPHHEGRTGHVLRAECFQGTGWGDNSPKRGGRGTQPFLINHYPDRMLRQLNDSFDS